MTALPPNPYIATADTVETRSIERTLVDGALVGEIIETIVVSGTGAREVTRTIKRSTTADGHVILEKADLRTCDACHTIIDHAAVIACSRCKRALCGRCIHRVIRDHQHIEACTPCRWRTLPAELLRLA